MGSLSLGVLFSLEADDQMCPIRWIHQNQHTTRSTPDIRPGHGTPAQNLEQWWGPPGTPLQSCHPLMLLTMSNLRASSRSSSFLTISKKSKCLDRVGAERCRCCSQDIPGWGLRSLPSPTGWIWKLHLGEVKARPERRHLMRPSSFIRSHGLPSGRSS